MDRRSCGSGSSGRGGFYSSVNSWTFLEPGALGGNIGNIIRPSQLQKSDTVSRVEMEALEFKVSRLGDTLARLEAKVDCIWELELKKTQIALPVTGDLTASSWRPPVDLNGVAAPRVGSNRVAA